MPLEQEVCEEYDGGCQLRNLQRLVNYITSNIGYDLDALETSLKWDSNEKATRVLQGVKDNVSDLTSVTNRKVQDVFALTNQLMASLQQTGGALGREVVYQSNILQADHEEIIQSVERAVTTLSSDSTAAAIELTQNIEGIRKDVIDAGENIDATLLRVQADVIQKISRTGQDITYNNNVMVQDQTVALQTNAKKLNDIIITAAGENTGIIQHDITTSSNLLNSRLTDLQSDIGGIPETITFAIELLWDRMEAYLDKTFDLSLEGLTDVYKRSLVAQNNAMLDLQKTAGG